MGRHVDRLTRPHGLSCGATKLVSVLPESPSWHTCPGVKEK